MEKEIGMNDIIIAINDLVIIIKQYIADQMIDQDKINQLIETYMEEHDIGNTLAEATTAILGGIRINGVTLVKNDDGTYSAHIDLVNDETIVSILNRLTVLEEKLNQETDIPVDTSPGGTMPEDTIPEDTIPEDTIPADAINMKTYGCVGDGQFDDTAKIKAALATNNISFYFPSGTYKISSTITVPAGKKIYGDGKDKSFIVSSVTGTLFFMKGNNDFIGLGLESTYGTVSLYGLITANNEGSNSNIKNCGFSSKACNGMKILGESAEVSKVLIENCYFMNIGRMGIEFQNHVSQNPNYDGYNNIIVRGCYFYNTGIKEYGMGISFSGWGSNNIIENNTFKKMGECGIEFVGCCSSLIQNNIFDDADSRFKFFECTNERLMHDNQIINNKSTSKTGSASNYLRSSRKMTFSGNSIGFIEVRDVTESIFKDNTYTPYGPYAIFVEGTSTNNIFSDSYIDLSKDPVSMFYSMIRINGANVKENTFSGLTTTVKPGGSYVSAINKGDLSASTFTNIQTDTGVVIYK